MLKRVRDGAKLCTFKAPSQSPFGCWDVKEFRDLVADWCVYEESQSPFGCWDVKDPQL